MHRKVSLPARLDALQGRGYLAVETEGYLRAEGYFFTELTHRRECLAYLHHARPAVFDGTLLLEDGTEQPVRGVVYVRAVREDTGRLQVRIQAATYPGIGGGG